MNYEFASKVGFIPWEDTIDNRVFVETITALFESEERRREPP